MFDYLHLQTCKQCIGQVAYFITVQCSQLQIHVSPRYHVSCTAGKSTHEVNMFPRESTYLYRLRFLRSEHHRPSYVGTTANVETCSACSYWSVVSESWPRVEYGGHVWHEMLPTKCVLGRMDMVSGQLETVGRNWTLRASLQRGIIKAIVRFHKSPLHREDTSLNSKLKFLLPSGHEPPSRKKR